MGEALVNARIEAARLREGVEDDLRAAFGADFVLEKTEEMALAYGDTVAGAAELLLSEDAAAPAGR